MSKYLKKLFSLHTNHCLDFETYFSKQRYESIGSSHYFPFVSFGMRAYPKEEWNSFFILNNCVLIQDTYTGLKLI